MDEKLQSIYDFMKSQGVEGLPEFQQFKTDFAANPETQRSTLDFMKSKGVEGLPDIGQFSNDIGVKKKDGGTDLSNGDSMEGTQKDTATSGSEESGSNTFDFYKAIDPMGFMRGGLELDYDGVKIPVTSFDIPQPPDSRPYPERLGQFDTGEYNKAFVGEIQNYLTDDKYIGSPERQKAQEYVQNIRLKNAYRNDAFSFSDVSMAEAQRFADRYGVELGTELNGDYFQKVKALKDKVNADTKEQYTEHRVQGRSDLPYEVFNDNGYKNDADNNTINNLFERLSSKMADRGTADDAKDVVVQYADQRTIFEKGMDYASPVYGAASSAVNNALLFGSKKIDANFITGLNQRKLADPVEYARIAKQIANGEPVASNDYFRLTNVGLSINNSDNLEGLSTGKQTIEDFISNHRGIMQQSSDLLLNTKDVLKSAIADELGSRLDEKAEKESLLGNNVTGSYMYSDEEINAALPAALQSIGVNKDDPRVVDAINSIKGDEGWMVGMNGVKKGGLVRELFKGAAQPFRGIAAWGDSFGKPLSQEYNEAKNQQLSTYTEQRPESMKGTVLNTLSDAVYGLGQFASQAGLAYAGGEIVGGIGALAGGVGEAGAAAATETAAARGALSGLDAAAESIAADAVSAGSKIGNYLLRNREAISTFATGYLQSYDSNLKTTLQMTEDDASAKLGAQFLAAMEGASELILPDVKLGREIIGGFKKEAIPGLLKNISENILKKGVDKNAWAKVGEYAGKRLLSAAATTGQEIAEEEITQLANYATNVVLNPKQAGNRDLGDELFKTAVSTAVSMSIPAFLRSGGGNHNTGLDNNKAALVLASANLTTIQDYINTAVSKGMMNPDEASAKMQIVNTAHSIASQMPANKNDGTKMNITERAEYLYSRTKEAALADAITKTTDDVLKERYKKEIAEEQALRKGLIEKTETRFDGKYLSDKERNIFVNKQSELARIDTRLAENPDDKTLVRQRNSLRSDIYRIRDGNYFGAVNNISRRMGVQYNGMERDEYNRVVEPAANNAGRFSTFNIKDGDEIVLPNNEKMTVVSADENRIVMDDGSGKNDLIFDGKSEFENVFIPTFFSGNKQFAQLNPTIHAQAVQFRKKLLNEPNADVHNIAVNYVRNNGIANDIDTRPVTSLNEKESADRAKRFEQVVHAPKEKATIDSYEALKKETLAQWNAITDAGYNLELWSGKGEPYSSSKAMTDDVRENKHLWILPTLNEFGSNEDFDASENPLLEKTGMVASGMELTYNDVFRGVHDFFGHAHIGNQFGAIGEENAWRSHSQMYSPLARKAMTMETRMQNSWVNFSGENVAALNLFKEAATLEKQSKDKSGNIIDRDKYEQSIALKKEAQLKFKFADQKVAVASDEDVQMRGAYDNVQEGLDQPSSITQYKKGETVSLADLQNEWPVTNEGMVDMFQWGKSQDVQIGFRAMRQTDGIAFYNPLSDEIYFNVSHPEFKSLTVADTQEFLAHELIHKAAHYSFENNPELAGEFNKDAGKVIAFLKQQDITKLDATTQKYISFMLEDNADPQELITYGMTNPYIAQWFASLEYNASEQGQKSGSVWQWMKEKILRFVSNIVKGKSVLDETARLLDKYVKFGLQTRMSEREQLHSQILEQLNNSTVPDTMKIGIRSAPAEDVINFIYEQATNTTNADGQLYSGREALEQQFGKELVDRVVDYKQREISAPLAANKPLEGKPERLDNESAFDYAKRVREWYNKARQDKELDSKDRRKAQVESIEERDYLAHIRDGVALLKINAGISIEDFNKQLNIPADNLETYIASLQQLTEDKEDAAANKNAKAVLDALRQQYPERVTMTEVELLRKQYNAYNNGYRKAMNTARKNLSKATKEFNENYKLLKAYKNAERQQMAADLKGKSAAERNELIKKKNEERRQKVLALKDKMEQAKKDYEQKVADIKDRNKYFRDKVADILTDLYKSGALKGVTFTEQELLQLAATAGNVYTNKTFKKLQQVIDKLINKADYYNKLTDARKAQREAKRIVKSGVVTQNDIAVIKELTGMNVSDVTDLDKYLSILKDFNDSRVVKTSPIRQYTNDAISDFITTEKDAQLGNYRQEIKDEMDDLKSSLDYTVASQTVSITAPDGVDIEKEINGIIASNEMSFGEKRKAIGEIDNAVAGLSSKISETLDGINTDAIVFDDIRNSADDTTSPQHEGLITALEDVMAAQQAIIDLDDTSLTDEQRYKLKVLKDVVLDGMDANELRLFSNVLNNYIDNNDDSGFDYIESIYLAQESVREMTDYMLDNHIVLKDNAYDGKVLGKTFESLSSVEQVFLHIANSGAVFTSKLFNWAGVNKFQQQAQKAYNHYREQFQTPLEEILNRNKKEMDIHANTRMQVFSILNQSIQNSSLLEKNKELLKRIDEMYSDIGIKRQGNNQEKAEAEIEYAQVESLRLLVADRAGIDWADADQRKLLTKEIFDNSTGEYLDPAEKEVYALVQKFYGDTKQTFQQTMNGLLNEKFEAWDNYSPDSFRNLNGGVVAVDENSWKGSAFAAQQNGYTLTGGATNQRVKGNRVRLAKVGDNQRVFRMDYLGLNGKNIMSMLHDVYTAKERMVMYNVLKSEDFIKNVGTSNHETMKKTITRHVNNEVGLQKLEQDAVSKNIRAVANEVGQLATKRQLYSFSAFVKQSISAYSNTAVYMALNGSMDSFLEGVRAAANDLDANELLHGQQVGRRGETKAGLNIFNDFNKEKELAAQDKDKSVFKKYYDKVVHGENKYTGERAKRMGYFIEKGDVVAARGSWLAYYAQHLVKNGVVTNASDIDWANENQNPNQEAVSYAQIMTSNAMNVNANSSRSEFQQSTSGGLVFVKAMLAAFSSFQFNKSVSLFNNLRSLSKGSYATILDSNGQEQIIKASEEQRKDEINTSYKTLLASLSEEMIFNAAKLGIGYTLYKTIPFLLGSLFGGDDDETKKRKKIISQEGEQSYWDNAGIKWWTNVFNGFALSIIPDIAQKQLNSGVNEIAKASGGDKIFYEPKQKSGQSSLMGSFQAAAQDVPEDVSRLYEYLFKHTASDGSPVTVSSKDKGMALLGLLSDGAGFTGYGDADLNRVLHAHIKQAQVDNDANFKKPYTILMNDPDKGRVVTVNKEKIELTDDQTDFFNDKRKEYFDKMPKTVIDAMDKNETVKQRMNTAATTFAKAATMLKYGEQIREAIKKAK